MSAETAINLPGFNPAPERRGYRITVLVDDPAAWIVPWATALVACMRTAHQATVVHDAGLIPEGDICFLLGCVRKLPSALLKRHPLNLVVHESDLPAGRGFSPVAWQVLEGRNSITVCLLEAVDETDSGRVFLRDVITLTGTELLSEIRRKQGLKTVELCLRFLEQWPDITARAQEGAPSRRRRRRHEDDRLDPYRSLADQFDHLRIVDNERYPAWFEYRGRRYILKLFPADPYEPPC